MRRIWAAIILASIFVPSFAVADASLAVNPLKYEEIIPDSAVRQGFIEVSNPSDTSVTVTSSVQGFRQANLNGDLAFFDDAVLSAAIIPDLPRFVLGAHEAIRVTFSVNPEKLPKGGVYAAIFFRTNPDSSKTKASYILESANVGTLLILQNGHSGQKIGRITHLKLPFFQFGTTIQGTSQVENSKRDTGALAFTPAIHTRISVLGKSSTSHGPMVFPGGKRNSAFSLPGSYLGLLPVSVSSDISSGSQTQWVLACTGNFGYIVLIFIAAALVLFFSSFLLRKRRRK